MTALDTTFFQKTHQYMRWLASRQKIIAQNLSNVDTPHYHAHDLVPLRDMVRRTPIAPACTHSGHLKAASTFKDFPLRKESVSDTRISNNTVSIETELSKSSDVSNAYALMVNQYKKTMSLFRTALRQS